MANSPTSSDGQAAACPINNLPEEILEMILKELSSPALIPGFTSKNPWQYLKVCKRWRRVYEPLLYHFPDLGHSSRGITRKSSMLLATIKSRPDLCACVRRLEIGNIVSSSERSEYERNVVELIQLCKPSLRSALLYTHMESHFPLAFRDALKGHQLHTLEVLGTRSDLFIKSLIYYRVSPKLRTLRLYDSAYLDSKFIDASEIYTHKLSQKSINLMIDHLTSWAGRSSITSLVLNESLSHDGMTKEHIAWPARLVELELTGLCDSYMPYCLTHTASEVQAMLEQHRESLEELRLGIMQHQSNGCHQFPTFTQFPKLRWLRIASQNLFDQDPKVAAARLNAPALERLDVESYLTRPLGRTRASGFERWHKDWLIDFGRAVEATSSSLSERQLSLRPKTISIQIIPESAERISHHFLYAKSENWESTVPRSWPWLHMKDVAKALSPLGFNVIFKPCISESVWHDMLEKQNDSTS